MAEKKNTVSVRMIDKALKEVCGGVDRNTTEIEWLGLKIDVKGVAGLADVIQIASEVASGCFLDDGRYVPEVKEFLFRKAVIEHYTNVRLPQDAEKQYDLLIGTDLIMNVMGAISEEQINDLRDAIDDKIGYLCDENISTERSRLNRLIELFNSIGENVEKIFGGVTGEDMNEMVKAIGKSGVDEEKLMKQFLDRKYGHEDKQEE